MNQTSPGNHPERALFNRFLLPVSIGLVSYLILFWTYYSSWYIDNRIIHYLLTDVVGALFGFFTLFNVLFVYPLLFFRGANPAERVWGSFLITFFWGIKEVYRMTEFYSLGESLFFLLFPIQFGIIVLAFGFMGLAEISCRYISNKKKGGNLKVVTMLPLTAVIFMLAVTVFILHDGGVSYYFHYFDLYKWLFIP
jgi:hypothetical protein